MMKNRFVISWTLISTLCISLIVSGIIFGSVNWRPADYGNIQTSIVVYFIYWILLASLQGAALFWKFGDKNFAYRWFFVTSITGFFVMFLHDLIVLHVMNVDTRGQGSIFLLLSLPSLAITGGFILGFAQLWLIKNRYKPNLEPVQLNMYWLFLGVVSWIIGFASFYLGNFSPALFILYPIGSIIKGWFINKYL
ncbi:hypothetical protein RIVM261_044280 [Rivularia sp. IAM M-261]|nr:hypothetical protein CAL7716_084800 [Calothrix sp. PCC 7716]GJD19472.1 hypothetical protein RIVM261_044280 [Rivularia sp. IAM M-261]